MLPLPETLPKVVNTVEPQKNRGWTPQTSDIIRNNQNRDITNAWDGTFTPLPTKNATHTLKSLQVRTPIQVGGGSLPEGGILPAQIGGVPVIPGSSVRGALLSWLNTIWATIPNDEQAFWQTLLQADHSGWQPRKIRFETIWLRDLKTLSPPCPAKMAALRRKKQTAGRPSGRFPPTPTPSTPTNLSFRCSSPKPPPQSKKHGSTTASKKCCSSRGIGRGTASGFGRLSEHTPQGKWQLTLTGMKPCVQNHVPKIKQTGEYRWSPQVLRANLRGYFHRLALSVLAPTQAQQLTDTIFGGLGCPAQLVLPSYIQPIPQNHQK